MCSEMYARTLIPVVYAANREMNMEPKLDLERPRIPEKPLVMERESIDSFPSRKSVENE